MMGALLTRAMLSGSLAQIDHVAPVRPEHASGLVARVYRQVGRDFGMLAPPVVLHSPAPDSLAAGWLMLRETLLARGLVDRATKETVATEVSLGNACPYCVDVHRALLHGFSGGGRNDGRSEAIAGWARASRSKETAALHPVPFSAGQAPELIGVAVTFQYLNRMVNVFLGDSPLPPQVPAGGRGLLLRLFGLIMRLSVREARRPGASLRLLPAAPLPADMSWAEGSPTVAAAFARAAAAVEAAGRRSVPGPVRDLVTARLDDWNGRPPGLGRGWTAEALSGLDPAQRPAGRLALLVAMASYQVDRVVVDEFRADAADDRTLVELASWASLAAARRIGGWTGQAALSLSGEASPEKGEGTSGEDRASSAENA
jgi:AhpD family alkylhydroperoxidase